jgi:hypothetical protein
LPACPWDLGPRAVGLMAASPAYALYPGYLPGLKTG